MIKYARARWLRNVNLVVFYSPLSAFHLRASPPPLSSSLSFFCFFFFSLVARSPPPLSTVLWPYFPDTLNNDVSKSIEEGDGGPTDTIFLQRSINFSWVSTYGPPCYVINYLPDSFIRRGNVYLTEAEKGHGLTDCYREIRRGVFWGRGDAFRVDGLQQEGSDVTAAMNRSRTLFAF